MARRKQRGKFDHWKQLIFLVNYQIYQRILKLILGIHMDLYWFLDNLVLNMKDWLVSLMVRNVPNLQFLRRFKMVLQLNFLLKFTVQWYWISAIITTSFLHIFWCLICKLNYNLWIFTVSFSITLKKWNVGKN